MRQLFLFFLLLSSTLFAEGEDIRSHFPTTAFANVNANIDCLIDGKVDAITGHYVDFQEDMRIDGPEPLILNRFTDMKKHAAMLGKSWDFDAHFPAYLQKGGSFRLDVEGFFCEDKQFLFGDKRFRLDVHNPYGGAMQFYGDNTKKKTIPLIPQPHWYKATNNPEYGRPSGKSNAANGKVFIKKDQRSFEMKSGGGDVSYYERWKKADKFRRTSECKANGITFTYDYVGDSLNLRNTSAKDLLDRTYASINFERRLGSLFIKGSNGDTVDYHFIKEDCLTSVHSNHGPDLYYSYCMNGNYGSIFNSKEDYKLVTRKTVGKSPRSPNWLEIHYYQHGHEGKNKLPISNIKLGIHKGDGRINRVRYLKNPYGVTHEFRYSDDYNFFTTTVVDSNRNQTKYVFEDLDHRTGYGVLNKILTNSILKYAGTGEKAVLLHKQEFTTDENRLPLRKADYAGDDKFLRSVGYDYDERFNITEEYLYGNLTGSGIDEKFTHWFTYSEDGYNNLLSEGDDESPTIEYRYLPNTDLLEARFVRDETGIRLREFRSYDELKLPFQEIYDNGSGEHSDDLTNVTERIIITRQLSHEPHSLGKPTQEVISYLDAETGQEVPLKTTTFVYDEKGKVIEQSFYDRHGDFCYTLKKAYNSYGKVIWENDASGNIIERTFDDWGNVLTQCGPDKRTTVKMTYDDICRPILQQIIHNDGTVHTAYTRYNLSNQVVSQEDALGRKCYYAYDALGNCIYELNDLANNAVDIANKNFVWKDYDVFGNLTKLKNNDGTEVEIEYTARSAVSQKKYMDGTCERWTYSQGGRLLSYQDRKGVTATYTYDRLGNRIREELSAGDQSLGVITHSYVGRRVIETTDQLGYQTHYKYDGAGRVIEKYFAGIITRYAYDNLGRRCEESLWKEGEETLVSLSYTIYDFLDRVVEEGNKDSNGIILKRRQYHYDPAGNKVAVVYWSSETQSATVFTDYDTYGRPIKVVDSQEKVTFNHYTMEKDPDVDTLVWICTTVDPTGRQTIIRQDAYDRPIEKIIKDSFGTTLAKERTYYDLGGRRVKCVITVMEDGKEAAEQVFLWKYNLIGELVEEVTAWKSPEQRIIAHEYAPGSLETKINKADGNIVLTDYDCKGRVKSFHDILETVSYTFDYDLLDRITTVHDDLTGITIQKTYDAQGNLCKENIDGIFEINLEFDPVGQISRIHYPDGSSVHYVYEGIRLKEVIRFDTQGHEAYRYVVHERNLFGLPLKTDLPGKAGTWNCTYDIDGRIEEIHSSHFKQKVLERDKEYKILKMEHTDSQGNWTENYTYDGNSNLASEGGLSNHQYTYDSLGNRLRSDNEFWKHNLQNQLLETGERHYTYDLNGNLQSDGTNHYSYDAFDRLIKVKNPDQTTTYTYDNLHRRLRKTVDGKVQNFAYIGPDEIGSYNAQGVIDTLRILAEGLGAEIGATIALEKAGTFYVPFHDQRGCIRSLVSGTTGEEVASYRYNAFGEVISSTGDTEISPWQFCSKRFDPETGFVYFGSRYYNTKVARWTTLDPLGFDVGPNGYNYVNNRPYCLLDLFGNYPTTVTDRTDAIAIYVLEERNRQSCGVTFDDNFEKRNEYGYEFSSGWFRKKRYDYSKAYKLTDEYDLGLTEIPGKRTGFINGVWNYLTGSKQSSLYISELGGDINIYSVYNATHGTCTDIGECKLNLDYIATPPVRMLHKTWNDFFTENWDNNAVFLMICHSQGAIHTRNALLTYPPELRNRIRVIAIAPAAYIDDDLCHSVKHYRADWTHDIVPYLDRDGAKRCAHTIVTLKSDAKADWFDHEFASPTYAPWIKREIEEYIQGKHDRVKY